MQLRTIGDKGYTYGVAVATLSFSPLVDRAAIVTRIMVTGQSADDNWIVSTTGQEIARFPVNGVGNNNMLGGSTSAFPKTLDIFDFAQKECGFELFFPVAQGQTITVASAGGATANIVMEYEEHTPGDIIDGMLNAQRSSHFVFPLFLVPPAALSAAQPAESEFASQIGPSWLPNLFGAVTIPAGYIIRILALFLEGAGVNTFSGAANHASVTDHLALIYNGQRMFTRAAIGGVPMIGRASAAGSANTVYDSAINPFPPFQYLSQETMATLESPFTLQPGSQTHFLFGTTGDVTGGANYAKALVGMLLDVQLTGMQPL